MKTTNKINAIAILNAFNSYNKSFNSAIRYIFDLSKESESKIPAAPAKDDKSETAKNLRKEIKAIEAKNAIINDAKRIVDTFNITANDIKDKSIFSLRKKIMERVPNVDENGRPVKFVKLPSYLKSEIKDYATIMQVVPASWIEAICDAAENKGEIRVVYNITIAPIIAEGKLLESACGDLVNTKGEIVGNEKIFALWNKEATINNIANAAGRVTVEATKKELKAK